MAAAADDTSLSELSETPSRASSVHDTDSSDEETPRYDGHAAKILPKATDKPKPKRGSRTARQAHKAYGMRTPVHKPRKRKATGCPSQGMESCCVENGIFHTLLTGFNVTG